MHGKNPIRKPVNDSGEFLEIVSIFPTLQGEGIYAGHPAIFIRLGGCNLACEFCDTEFENFSKHSIKEILDEVKTHHNNQKLIVITGGEPMRQPISKLCQELISKDFKVQIETNGTLYRELPEDVEIICSPKIRTKIRNDLLSRINAFKFIISASNDDYKTVPNVGQTNQPVYIQPMDEYDAKKNKANMELAKNIAMESGYNLSLQLHKIIGVD